MATPTPKEKLVAIYNADRVSNRLAVIDGAEFDIEAPVAYSGSRSPKNTRVYLTPKPASVNIGRITLYYDRISLATITTLMVKKTTETKTVDLVGQLSDELGVVLIASDIVDTTLPATGPFTLTATATNLMYTGSVQVAYEP